MVINLVTGPVGSKGFKIGKGVKDRICSSQFPSFLRFEEYKLIIESLSETSGHFVF